MGHRDRPPDPEAPVSRGQISPAIRPRKTDSSCRRSERAVLNLKRILKSYEEAGSLNAMVNLFGFVGPHVFLTKSGEVGVILEMAGVDYECLETAAVDGLTKRLESALRLFDENYRVYQLLFKRNGQAIPHSFCGNPVVDAAIRDRVAYFSEKAENLFSLSIYFVVLCPAL